MVSFAGAGDTLFVDHETKLLGDLLNLYNKMAIPRFNSSANVTVRFGIMPINLVELVCNSPIQMRTFVPEAGIKGRDK